MARSAVMSPQSVSVSRSSRHSTTVPTPVPRSHASRAPSTLSRATSSVQRNTPGPSDTAAARPVAVSIALPPYQPPTLPLNTRGLDALDLMISSDTTFRDLTERLKQAAKNLNECAGDINDCARDNANAVAELVRKRPSDGEAENEEIARREAQLATLRERVQNMTGRIDNNVRKIIDGYAGLEILEESMKDAKKKAAEAVAAAAGDLTLQTQTQHTTQASATTDDQPSVPSLTSTLTQNITRQMDKYTTQSLTARYSKHNDYIEFKRVVNDSLHPDLSRPVPHPSTWFQREEGRGSPAPGITGHADDSDDDIAISRETISTRCPLTLQNFEDPVTSTKCPHSYEREAILQLIAHEPRPPVPRGANADDYVKRVRCPVTGCEHRLGEADLVRDAVLVRKIRRMQAAKEREREEMLEKSGEGGSHTVEEIESDSEGEDIDVLERRTGMRRGRTPAARVKAEMVRSSMRQHDEIMDD